MIAAAPKPALDIANLAVASLLGNSDLETEKLLRAAGAAAARADFADLYLECSTAEGWALEEGIVKTGSFSAGRGMSLRTVSGDTAVLAYADDISIAALTKLSAVAKAGTNYSGELSVRIPATGQKPPKRYDCTSPLGASDEAKSALLHQLDDLARRHDPRVINVQANLGMCHETIIIARSDGAFFADIRPMVRLGVQVLIAEQGKVETGNSGKGGRYGIELFTKESLAEMVAQAVSEAAAKIVAQPTPAGLMPVVLGNGWAGILLHEAVGHGLEGDFNRKHQSAYSGLIGEKVAHERVTIIDDGTLVNRRGSLTYDDEGVPCARNVLIENGILRGYLQDSVNASLMGQVPTGNGRRESYAHLPMPRMTNTFMPAGSAKPEEVIASVDRGIYFKSFTGGQVDITNGNFVFVASEAYLIEKGRLGVPVKGATITGNGPEAMRKLSMVADDLKIDPGIGTCGKNGQWVPVGVGQPTCRVDELVVGGTIV